MRCRDCIDAHTGCGLRIQPTQDDACARVALSHFSGIGATGVQSPSLPWCSTARMIMGGLSISRKHTPSRPAATTFFGAGPSQKPSNDSKCAGFAAVATKHFGSRAEFLSRDSRRQARCGNCCSGRKRADTGARGGWRAGHPPAPR